MIVLSAYYILSDKDDYAYIVEDEMENEQSVSQNDSYDNTDIDYKEVENMNGSEFFTTIRMELQDKRNLQKDRLLEVIASNNVSANEINDALDEINVLENLESKEEILRETILSTDEQYDDVLVRTEDDKVHVHIITENLSKEAAVHIMQMVRDEIGIENVDVNFQPVKG